MSKINNDKRNMRQIAKGHFQTSFVINLIKNVLIQKDFLYALLVHCSPYCNKRNCEYEEIRLQVDKALSFLGINQM